MSAFRLFNTWRNCANDKAAYLEILRALQLRHPQIFESLSKSCATRKRRFLARESAALFPGSPHLADNPSHCSQLVPGWYADTNLSNRQKERVLMHACAAASIAYFTDLEVRFEAGHYSPMTTNEAATLADKLLEELRSS